MDRVSMHTHIHAIIDLPTTLVMTTATLTPTTIGIILVDSLLSSIVLLLLLLLLLLFVGVTVVVMIVVLTSLISCKLHYLTF